MIFIADLCDLYGDMRQPSRRQPAGGGRGAYVSFAVPENPALAALVAGAATRPAPCGPAAAASADRPGRGPDPGEARWAGLFMGVTHG